MSRRSVAGILDPGVVPRVLLRAVDGVEIVAVGTLQFARDVLVSAVSGAANIGAAALTATVAGARGVVSAASQMVGDVAGTAQGTLRTTIDNARRSGRASTRAASRRAATLDAAGARVTPAAAPARARRRTRRLRLAPRPARPSVAA
jgi:hypothetical protein